MTAPEEMWRNWRACDEEDRRAATLTAIGASGDAWDLPRLLEVVLYGAREGDVEPASEAMSAIVLRISPADLPKYELELRLRLPSLTPASLLARRARLEIAPSWVALGLCTWHPNGYVRELAVRWLAAAAADQALPFLVLRVNDWVSQVRDAARQGVESRLSLTHAEALVAALPLVLRLRQLGRARHGEIVGRTLAVLRDPACLEALIRGLSTSDLRSRSEVYRAAIQNQSVDAAVLLGHALADDGERIRLWASRQLRQHFDLQGWAELADRSSRDRFASVRRDALISFAQRGGSVAIEKLERGLLDENAAVRALAANHLCRQRPGFETAAVYRRELASADPTHARAAILGLGEFGTSDDADIVVRFANHRVGKIRSAAVRSLGRLRPEQCLPLLLSALIDKQRRVSHEAAAALARQPHLLPRVRADLTSIDHQAILPNVKRHISRLLQLADDYASKWG